MTQIPAEIIKYEIVTSANEDISGLYEVLWALNTLYPTVSKSDMISLGKLAIVELLQTGIIDLYLRNWNTQIEIRIEPEEALEIVMRDESWEPPNDETNSEYYCFFATGDKTLEEQNRLYLQVNGG